jgi:hypothetical protein
MKRFCAFKPKTLDCKLDCENERNIFLELIFSNLSTEEENLR